MKYRTVQIILVFLLAGAVYAENTPVFKRQIIEFPAIRAFELWQYWGDINGDLLTDLMVLNQEESVLYIYSQNQSGFPPGPTQTITFSKDVAWFMLYDIDEHPGDEMLISTNEGLFYYCFNQGVFETTPEKLIEAKQIIPRNHPPIIKVPGEWAEDSKGPVPVVFSDYTMLYQCDKNYQLKPVQKIEHEFKRSIGKDASNNWSLGLQKSSQLWTITIAFGKPEEDEKKQDVTKENSYIENLVEKIKKDYSAWQYGIEEKDINADGRDDLALWYFVGEIDTKMTISVFVRQEDGKLPDKPSQILVCRGFPVYHTGLRRGFSIFEDIDNDGILEIVLAELKDMPLSAGSAIEMAVSQGMKFTISIRQFKKPNGFSNKADFKMDVTTLLPISDWVSSLVMFNGDFNADGRKDLIVRRNPTLCNIYLSSTTSGFYNREPELQLEGMIEGRIFVVDLNYDGISDIYTMDYEKGRILLFLSGSLNKKGALK